ncbi:cyclic AMP-dependent transcription factor ATF-6 alpha isoform X2 [Paramormyrops kingsleyae]|uniref:cyclic AMP-dependent transcription factor ATF-6 alpha isoform X2 n=1 Tax=Paramormyrops kingsleyae TaxID=1676925 RepID=UPI000CD61E55|nr:cyclic AMP-dependent transcription factor ATF-6 alpha isoform X2 [Paramormyrops kingsleyae]
METSLTLDSEYHTNHQPVSLNADEMDDICIDQEGEWDMSLFDDLGEPESAEDLLLADRALDLDFDLDLPVWSPDTSGGASSPYTDTEVSSGSLSPHHATSSVTSPGSVEALSPLDLLVEPLSPQSQASPASISSETSSFSDVVQDRKTQRRSNQASRAKTSQPIKRPIHHAPKVSIQPKPVVAFPIVHATPLQAKTIIIQPVQTVLPRDQVTPVAIRPAPLKGAPMTLAPQAMPLPLPAPQVPPSLPAIKLGEHPVTVTTLSQDGGRPSVGVVPFPTPPPSNAGSDSISRRQQRMMKNRESASLSRKKKKEYLLTLEARLKVALFENQQLKMENGTLKKQLDSLAAENNVLKVTAPKRRAVCLMVVLMFVMLNAGSLSLFDRDPNSNLPVGTMHSGRHLLEFSGSNQGNTAPQMQKPSDRSEDSKEKALMVVKKDSLQFEPPPPCQPTINRTKSIRLAHELRGWVHRHEVERTKTRRTTNSQQKNKTILKTPGEKAEVSQIVTVQYTDTLEKSSGSELQVYYARHGYYNEFFEEIHRRGDTFYVVSFRRDHLLLPATSHNKRSRPKMSVVLPAMNVNETVIKDEEYEVMMQIDCEVMDTRILRIKTSSIPPFLRTNHSDSYSTPASDKSASSVGVLTGSV